MAYIVKFTFKTGQPNLVGPFDTNSQAQEFMYRWQQRCSGADINIQVCPLEQPRFPEDCQPFERRMRDAHNAKA